jgi:hypothetical protein
MNRRANRGRMGKSQKSAKPYGRATPNWIPQSGIHFSPSLSQAKDHPSINVRKILDTSLKNTVNCLVHVASEDMATYAVQCNAIY